MALTPEQIKALMQAHSTAMFMTCKARVPECGEFAAIAQDLDWLCESFGIKGGQHGTDDGNPIPLMRTVEAEVRKQDEALILQLVEALESVDNAMPFPVARQVLKVARARLGQAS